MLPNVKFISIHITSSISDADQHQQKKTKTGKQGRDDSMN